MLGPIDELVYFTELSSCFFLKFAIGDI